MNADYSRAEVEEAFRHYFLTGPVLEDWAAWSQLFLEDAVYFDHFYGRFRGPAEIRKFLEATMGYAPQVYSPLEWYNLDGNRIVYKVSIVPIIQTLPGRGRVPLSADHSLCG